MNSNKLLFIIIILAACLTQFASDIYAPSVSAISKDLQTHIELVQWSMAIYMLGVALSQLVYGPISEGLGRKTPLVIGLKIMLMGSLICVIAPTIHILIFGRLLQGCGAGSCASLWRAVFRDTFKGEELAKYGSYLVIFIMFIVPAAPALGGYLQDYIGWRASFIFITLYTVIVLVAVIYGFRETSQHHDVTRLRLPFILATFRRLLRSHVFMGATLATFLSYGAFFAWFVTGPVLLIHVVKISPITFGWLTFLGCGSAYALAGWLNGRVVTHYGMTKMLRLGWSIMIISGVLLLMSYLVLGVTVWAIILPIILFYFGATFIWPNAFATAFTPFGDIAGYAAALYGFLQISGAAVIGGLMSYLPTSTQIPLAIVIIISSVIAWLGYEFLVPNSNKN